MVVREIVVVRVSLDIEVRTRLVRPVDVQGQAKNLRSQESTKEQRARYEYRALLSRDCDPIYCILNT
jgi:hypothetical protein